MNTNLVLGQRFNMCQRFGSVHTNSEVEFIGLSTKGEYLLFRDMENFYWGLIPVKGIRFAVPVNVFPAYTYKSFGQEVYCSFEKIKI